VTSYGSASATTPTGSSTTDREDEAVLLNHRRVGRVAIGMLVAAAVVTVLVSWDVTAGAVQWVDDGFADAMESARFRALTVVVEAISFLGVTWVTVPVRVLASVLLVVRRRYVQLSAFLLAVVTSELAIGPLKALIDRPRPPDALVATSGASFPSGHAIAGAVTAVALVVALFPPGPRRWRWELRAALVAFVIALSRTYLGAHWLSDVVAGSLIGAGLALGWPALLQEVRDVRLPRHRVQAG
jgi:membrane-associated phospholipid phosphatase